MSTFHRGEARIPRCCVSIDEGAHSGNEEELELRRGDSLILEWIGESKKWAVRSKSNYDIERYGGISALPPATEPRPPTPRATERHDCKSTGLPNRRATGATRRTDLIQNGPSAAHDNQPTQRRRPGPPPPRPHRCATEHRPWMSSQLPACPARTAARSQLPTTERKGNTDLAYRACASLYEVPVG